MRWFLVMGVVLLLQPTPTVVTGQTPAAQQPTWTVGDTWTYNDPISRQVKYTVVATTPDYYVVEFLNGSNRSVVNVALDLYPKGSVTVSFQCPLAQGATWKRAVTGAAPDGHVGMWEITSVVETYEIITVPAGNFEAFRIKGRHCVVNGNTCGDYSTWYAPQAKFYAKIAWGPGYWPDALRGHSRELVSYQVHSP